MISVTILTKNSKHYLRKVLSSVKDFDEVVLYDTGSTDETLEIATEYPNVRIYREAFIGFGPTHNRASEAAENDWILSIDSDEIVTEEILEEIRQLQLDEKCVYSFPRHNYFNGKFIKWCGWYPDRRYRLYNRKRTQFSEAHVHEAVEVNGMKHVPLKGAIRHYSYDSIGEFLEKMHLYSNLFAEQYRGKRKSSLPKALFRGFFAFFKSYILKRGFLGGYEGFVISLYNGHTAYYKYLKLKEANQRSQNV